MFHSRAKTLLGLLAVGCGLTAPHLAAQPESAGRLVGVVRGANGEPLEGAEVRLWRGGTAESGAFHLTTNGDGSWARIGLQPGRWEIRVRAEGHVDGLGWVVVSDQRPTLLEMALRSLDEESAAFSEGGSATLGTWLERANSFLAHGRASEARDEYRKVLTLVSVDERPQILRAVARTWYLEGEVRNALDTLEEALRIAPQDAESRLLYRGLLEQSGSSEEADARLAEIEAAGPPPLPPATPPRRSFPSSSAPPAEAPRPHRTGRQRVFFTETNPLGEARAYVERFDLTEELDELSDEAPGPRSLDGETFEVYVPQSYRPEAPHGLLVWVSPTPFGGFRDPDYSRVLADQQLIWVGADRSGNSRASWDRAALALDAVYNATNLYSIDPNRIYAAGYSGGGRLSSSLVLLYPDVFAGGIFFYGCNWFERLPVPDKPGSLWPEKFRRPPDLSRLKSESRLVFVTGELDFNRQQTKATYERALELGFEHATYLEIPAANHYYGIPAKWLERSLEALSGD